MEDLSKFYEFLDSITEFSKSDFENSIPYFSSLVLKKGDYWLKPNQHCRHIAYIKSGILRQFYSDHKGNDVTACFCITNQITSSFKSFLSQQPSELAIQALDKTDLITIDFDSLQILYKRVSVWQEVNRLLLEKEYLTLWKYSNSLNTETAKEKYLRLIDEQPVVLQKASVQDIASYLGVTRETLSRIRKQIAT